MNKQKNNEDEGKSEIFKSRPKSQHTFNFFHDENDIGMKLRNAVPELKQINIEELLGFNLETRIRKMVTDCVEPLKISHDMTKKRVTALEKNSKSN